MKIDWKKIKEKCPRSYENIETKLNGKYQTHFGVGTFLNVIDGMSFFQTGIHPSFEASFDFQYAIIEKFFDDNKIIINYEKINDDFEYSWYYNIRVDNFEIEDMPEEYNSRDEAKEQAVYKAFEIMEKGYINE